GVIDPMVGTPGGVGPTSISAVAWLPWLSVATTVAVPTGVDSGTGSELAGGNSPVGVVTTVTVAPGIGLPSPSCRTTVTVSFGRQPEPDSVDGVPAVVSVAVRPGPS